MAEILLKRGLKANLPVLKPGEPAFTTDTHEFFIGSENGNIQYNTKNGVSVQSYPFSGTFTVATASIDLKVLMPIYQLGDSVQVYIGGLLQTRDENYSLIDGVVTKLDDGTGIEWPVDYTYDIFVWKNVDSIEPDEPWIDGGTF